MVTGTRNTTLEPHVDDGVKQWVTAHVEAALERVKIDMRAIVTEALQSHNGRTGEVVRVQVPAGVHNHHSSLE